MRKKIKEVLGSEFASNSINRTAFIASVVIFVLTLFFTIIQARVQEGRIVVGFTPFDRRLGLWYEIFQLPLTGLALLLINNVFGYLAYSKDRVISYTALLINVLLQFLLLIVVLNFLAHAN